MKGRETSRLRRSGRRHAKNCTFIHPAAWPHEFETHRFSRRAWEATKHYRARYTADGGVPIRLLRRLLVDSRQNDERVTLSTPARA